MYAFWFQYYDNYVTYNHSGCHFNITMQSWQRANGPFLSYLYHPHKCVIVSYQKNLFEKKKVKCLRLHTARFLSIQQCLDTFSTLVIDYKGLRNTCESQFMTLQNNLCKQELVPEGPEGPLLALPVTKPQPHKTYQCLQIQQSK